MTPPPIQIQKLTERQIRAMLPGWAQSYGVVVDYVHAYNRALTCTTSAARARARQAMGAALDVMTSKAAKLALADDEWPKIRCHRHAMLLATKLLFRELWMQWNPSLVREMEW